MNRRAQLGQLITVGGIIGGLAPDGREDAVMRALATGKIGGVYVGYPHFRDPAAARHTIDRFQAIAPAPLFVAADFEAGPGYNCEGSAAHLPYFMGLGFLDDPAAVAQAAEITARQALAMGVNWLYSPCVDVNLRPDNPIIGIRSFGEITERVSRLGVAFIEACNQAGVISSAKHFPGTGNTAADAHTGCANDLGDLKTWETKTLPPFADAVRAGVPAVMTGHAALPFLDPSGAPATFSKPILTGILRDRLGYDGIIISDSLGMGGAWANRSMAERCLLAFEAGCDVLLAPWDPEILPAFEKALCAGRISEDRLEASLERVRRAKARLARLPRMEIRPDDEAAARTLGRRAVRVLRHGGILPLQRGSFACLTQWRNAEAQFFPREPSVLAFLQHGLQLFDPAAPLVALSRACPESEHADVFAQIGNKKTVVLNAIVKSYAGDPFKGLLSDGTAALVAKLTAAGKRTVLVLLGSPYPAGQVPDSCAVVCAGGDTLGSAEGALALLTGPRAGQ